MTVIRFEVDRNIALVTIDQPPVNAFNRAMGDQLIAACDEISERDDIRVAVLTGLGKTICAAGADGVARKAQTGI